MCTMLQELHLFQVIEGEPGALVRSALTSAKNVPIASCLDNKLLQTLCSPRS